MTDTKLNFGTFTTEQQTFYRLCLRQTLPQKMLHWLSQIIISEQ